jgi:hypothetical protein
VQTFANVRPQYFRQIRLAGNIQKEDDKNQRENTASNLQREARPPPPPPFLIVENGLAISHSKIPS